MSTLKASQRRILQLIAERTDDRSPDPGTCTSSETFADTYNVWVHWRTARVLHRRGLVTFPYEGGVDEGSSIALTDAGWAVLRAEAVLR